MDVIDYNWTLRDRLKEYNELPDNASTESKLFYAQEVIKVLNDRVKNKQSEEKFVYHHLLPHSKPFITLKSFGQVLRVPGDVEVFSDIDLNRLMEDMEFYSACKTVCRVLKEKIEKKEQKENE